MANMIVLVTTLDRETVAAGQAKIIGICLVDGNGPQINWEVEVAMSSLPGILNNTVRDAAVAACATAGFTVGPTDNKILFAGAVAL